MVCEAMRFGPVADQVILSESFESNTPFFGVDASAMTILEMVGMATLGLVAGATGAGGTESPGIAGG
jgi:hypothetical protein